MAPGTGMCRLMRANLLGIVIVCNACCASGVVGGEDAYTLAARKYAAGDYAAASQDFEVLLQQQTRHPRASDARFYLAEAKLQLEDLDAARAHYAEFLKL